jgi:probable addiction module antidote protein
MAVTFAPYVPGEYMTTPERVVAFLKLSFEEDKPEEIAESLGIVARSAGMTEIARRSGLSRESLYRALSPDGKPQLETIMRVLQACGLRLTVEPIPGKKAEPARKAPAKRASIAPSATSARRKRQSK